jgi:uncharacterized membrane protein
MGNLFLNLAVARAMRRSTHHTLTTIEATVEIDAPLETVFSFVADHANVLDYMDNVVSFESVSDRKHGVGSKFRWTTLIKGIPIGSEFIITEFEPPHTIAARSISGPNSTSRWKFACGTGNTVATFVASYAVPRFAVLRHLTDLLRLEGEIETNIASSLRNLKHLMERESDRSSKAPTS